MPFMSILHSFLVLAVGGNHTITTCDSSISHYEFYQLSLLPAIVLTLLFASTTTRRGRLLNFLRGRPGLIFPMDTLTRNSRISYCCAFGATAFLVYQILLEQKFAIEYSGPVSFVALVAIFTMFVYGMVFFPVFACLALSSAFSFGLGALYVWMIFAVNVYRMTECDLTVKGRAIMVARSVPSLGCLAYLSISLPMRCIAGCYRKQFFSGPEEETFESMGDIQQSYQGVYIKGLFKKAEDERGKRKDDTNCVKTRLARWTYHNKPGFRYPSRLVSVLFVAASVVYVTSVEFLATFTDIFDKLLISLESKLDVIGWESVEGESAGDTSQRILLLLANHYVFLIKVCTNVSILASCVFTFLNILHMLASFRSNLIAMYKGDFQAIPPPSQKRAVWLCSGSIKFAGFQVAYIVWAYIFMCFILFTFSVTLALLLDGHAEWFFVLLLDSWPSILIALALLVIQILLAKYVFLQGLGQYLQLDNRHSYFIFAYFMFFYNIFLGLVSCLLRVLRAIIIGAFILARLDNSSLPRNFEHLDPGLNAYIGYIHVEAAHSNPIVQVFIRILVCLRQERRDREESTVRSKPTSEAPLSQRIDNSIDGDEREDSRHTMKSRAKFRWLVLYTLLQNPQMKVHRKGYLHAVRKSLEKGVKASLSDKYLCPFHLAHLHTQKEYNSSKTFTTSGTQTTLSSFKKDDVFRSSPSNSTEWTQTALCGLSEDDFFESSSSNSIHEIQTTLHSINKDDFSASSSSNLTKESQNMLTSPNNDDLLVSSSSRSRMQVAETAVEIEEDAVY